MQTDLLKIGFAGLLGIILGLERELKRKPLGLKTTLVICVASCLIAMVSFESAAHYSEKYQFVDADPTRIAAAIVSGVGFLGAGVILRRSNEMIVNLTTAAIIWAASGLGIAVATGFYIQSIVALIVIILSVEFVPFLMKKMGPNTLRQREVQITFITYDLTGIENILQKLMQFEIKVEHVKINVTDDRCRISLLCIVSINKTTLDIYRNLRSIQGIKDLEMEFL